MRIPYTANIGIIIGAALLALSASSACGQQDHERIAEDVAREWVTTEAEDISEEIAAMATRRYGGRVFVEVIYDSPSSSSKSTPVDKKPYEGRIPMSADAGQIQETMQWEFAPPTKSADGRYEVIATASISFDIVPSKSSDYLRELPELHLPMLTPRRPHTLRTIPRPDTELTPAPAERFFHDSCAVGTFGLRRPPARLVRTQSLDGSTLRSHLATASISFDIDRTSHSPWSPKDNVLCLVGCLQSESNRFEEVDPSS